MQKGTSDQTREVRNGMRFMDNWGRVFQIEGIANGKDLSSGCAWCVQRTPQKIREYAGDKVRGLTGAKFLQGYTRSSDLSLSESGSHWGVWGIQVP